MKLLYCEDCKNFLHLQTLGDVEVCECGCTRGKMVDRNEYLYSGDAAVPIHVDERSFTKAISNRQPNMTSSFKSCVEPRKSYSFRKVELLKI